jgi:hypothetical protein
MDSQVTLVDPRAAAHGGASTILELDKDNVRNTNIRRLGGGGPICYTVSTTPDMVRTEVRDASGGKVAEIKYRELRSDTVAFGDQPARSLNSWLRSRKQ